MHSTWHAPAGRGSHLRVVVEDDDPALAVSDFRLYEEAGLDVVVCHGPDGSGAGRCPVLDDEPCDLIGGAHVVLHGLDSPAIASAVRRVHPDVGVVVRVGAAESDVTDGAEALPATASVAGQVRAVRRAGTRRPR